MKAKDLDFHFERHEFRGLPDYYLAPEGFIGNKESCAICGKEFGENEESNYVVTNAWDAYGVASKGWPVKLCLYRIFAYNVCDGCKPKIADGQGKLDLLHTIGKAPGIKDWDTEMSFTSVTVDTTGRPADSYNFYVEDPLEDIWTTDEDRKTYYFCKKQPKTLESAKQIGKRMTYHDYQVQIGELDAYETLKEDTETAIEEADIANDWNENAKAARERKDGSFLDRDAEKYAAEAAFKAARAKDLSERLKKMEKEMAEAAAKAQAEKASASAEPSSSASGSGGKRFWKDWGIVKKILYVILNLYTFCIPVILHFVLKFVKSKSQK